jgi:hypothetical protein
LYGKNSGFKKRLVLTVERAVEKNVLLVTAFGLRHAGLGDLGSRIYYRVDLLKEGGCCANSRTTFRIVFSLSRPGESALQKI